MSVSQKTTVPENGRTDGQMEVRLAREGERERESGCGSGSGRGCGTMVER